MPTACTPAEEEGRQGRAAERAVTGKAFGRPFVGGEGTSILSHCQSRKKSQRPRGGFKEAEEDSQREIWYTRDDCRRKGINYAGWQGLNGSKTAKSPSGGINRKEAKSLALGALTQEKIGYRA